MANITTLDLLAILSVYLSELVFGTFIELCYLKLKLKVANIGLVSCKNLK